jgi:hypothetical protein
MHGPNDVRLTQGMDEMQFTVKELKTLHPALKFGSYRTLRTVVNYRVDETKFRRTILVQSETVIHLIRIEVNGDDLDIITLHLSHLERHEILNEIRIMCLIIGESKIKCPRGATVQPQMKKRRLSGTHRRISGAHLPLHVLSNVAFV